MSLSNNANRPEMTAKVGAVAATIEVGVLVAHKKMELKNLSLMDIVLVAASGSNFIQAQALKNGTLIGTVVDTQAGLAARQPLDLNLGTLAERSLAAGDVVTVVLTKAGTGALTEASLHVDALVIGQ